MYPSTSMAENTRNVLEPAHRKWAPIAAMNSQPEPLKVFLQHRIKSIISKEWWDFVVNVNNMNSDHASLLYSVANLCPSFQNFLRTRDKELSYILKKRPQIKPRIFSGSEKSDIPTIVAPTEVPSAQRKSCSAELDQILNELYPNERSIIKRKPRTFGPISKQKRLQNLKRFQLLQAQKEVPAEDSSTPTLSKILREDKPCTTVRRPESLSPSTSNRDSKHGVEYTISNYDINKNKLSLNMKKVKKIIKVKKKIMTYTDNNDKSRTKYLLESETPDLKRELIKKYRIKKCNVVLQRLTWKQIKESKAKAKITQAQLSSLTNDVKISNANSVTDNEIVPPISLKLNLGKAISIQKVNSPEASIGNRAPPPSSVNRNDSSSLIPSTQVNSVAPEIPLSKNEQKIRLSSEEVPDAPETEHAPKELAVFDNISKACEKLLSNENETEAKRDDQTPAQLDSNVSAYVIEEKNEQSNGNVIVHIPVTMPDIAKSITIKSERSLQPDCKQTVSQVNGIKASVIISNNGDKTALINNNIQSSDIVSSSKAQPAILKTNNSITVIKKEPVKETSAEHPKTTKNEEKPATTKNEEKPATTKNEEKPATTKNEEKPATTKNEEKPATTKNEEKPATTKNEEKPATTKNEEKPATTKREEKPSATKNEEKHAETSSKSAFTKTIIKKEGGSSLKKIDDSPVNTSSSLSKQESISKLVIDSVNPSPLGKFQEKEPENQSLTMSSKVHHNQKENVAVLDKFNSKEELKTVYCHGGIVPLGKNLNSVLEKSTFDKKHLLSLKDKKIKETNSDGSDSTTPLKEKNVLSIVSDSKPEIPPLSGLRNKEEIKENFKSDKPDISNVSSIKTEVIKHVNDNVKESISVESGSTSGEPLNEDFDIAKGNSESAAIKDSPNNLQESSNSLQNSSLEVGTEVEDDPEKDDVIIIENPLEIIDLDSPDEDAEPVQPPIRMKVERIEYNSRTVVTEEDVDLNQQTENDSNRINTSEEPLPKRPRLEINLTKMTFDNINCKVCNTSFKSHAEWLQHYDNEVPKCAPNLKVSWGSPEQSLMN